MIALYLDTSCIVKLYIDEADSEDLKRTVQRDILLATSAISYVEMHSAMARRQREKTMTASEAHRVRDVFEVDWGHYLRVEVGEEVIRSSALLVKRHGLRAYDALQLASALRLRMSQSDVVFLTADRALQKAAVSERLHVHV